MYYPRKYPNLYYYGILIKYLIGLYPDRRRY